MKACAFFGHRDTLQEVEPRLKAALLDLIEKDEVRSFYVGTQGSFDAMVLKQLFELKKTHGIRYFIVLAYPPKKRLDFRR